MKKRTLILAASMALLQGCYTPHTSSRVSVGVGYPGVDIGIHYSTYPDLVPIPGYPVYYAPGVVSNYFFYDGLYWAFHGDNWYVSSWYNGPWGLVSYYDVPVFVLRIPVRYYRQPPPYFHGWHADAPPRWGEHWGRDWEQRRSGWDHWDRSAAPAPAPLPSYQRNYSGDRYPHAAEQQRTIRSEHYRYQPRDPIAQRHFQPRVQQDQQRQLEHQHREDRQRQPKQQHPQDRQDQPHQLHDQRQRSHPEPRDRSDKAQPQDRQQRGEDARQNDERTKRGGVERDRNR